MNKIIFPILVALFALVSCQQQKEGSPLARVGDDILYEKDLAGLLPPNTEPLDSIVWVRNYTHNWIKTKLLLNKAMQNLDPKDINFEQQLEKYRNSLISYTYETELIHQQMDTTVSDSAIQKYYNSHQKDFVLLKNIVRAMYVVIENNKSLEKHFVHLFKLPDSIMMDSLQYNCKEYSANYFLDTTVWLPFDEVTKTIPLKTYNKELFLKNNKFVKVKDKYYVYLINFVDFKIKNDFSPLELEQNNIRNIIINSRKMDFIKVLHEKIYQEAARKNEFEIYTYDK
ncbi:MAG: hypothetical protein DRJ09_04995 [Bacteroidetes bacterium]|nr:MAG: hypothetical protein DRJ09_04995 [Bacteroidota bacterium]